MSAVKENFRAQLGNRTIWKLLLWFILSLALSLVFFREFWTNLPGMLSPSWVLGQHHAFPWGVLVLCLIFLWLKRKEIASSMRRAGRRGQKAIKLLPTAICLLPTGTLGLGLVVGAVLMPSFQDYLVFQVLLASLGVFVILFGKGAKIPSIILAIYGFATSFPLAIQRFAEDAYSQTAIAPMMGVMTTLGYPLQNQGQWVHFVSSGGEPISVAITIGCAGPATMGVFIALFTLMVLDMPLPPKKAAWLFGFGVVGTWFQSFLRLVILMLVGYYWGKDAMMTAHFWTIYILFPLWYLVFAYVYFRQLDRKSKNQNAKGRMTERK